MRIMAVITIVRKFVGIEPGLFNVVPELWLFEQSDKEVPSIKGSDHKYVMPFFLVA